MIAHIHVSVVTTRLTYYLKLTCRYCIYRTVYKQNALSVDTIYNKFIYNKEQFMIPLVLFHVRQIALNGVRSKKATKRP